MEPQVLAPDFGPTELAVAAAGLPGAGDAVDAGIILWWWERVTFEILTWWEECILFLTLRPVTP